MGEAPRRGTLHGVSTSHPPPGDGGTEGSNAGTGPAATAGNEAPATRRAAAVASAQAAAARLGGGVDHGLTRAQPILTVASRSLSMLGWAVVSLSVAGAVGACLLVLLGLRSFGWPGLLLVVFGLAPGAGWRVGRRAIRGAGLLDDPRRVLAAAKASGEAGRQWLDHMAALGGAAKNRKVGGVARSAIGAGRSLWRAVGPDVEGADDLRALALWPRTLAMAAAGVLSPLLLAVGLIWGLVTVVL